MRRIWRQVLEAMGTTTGVVVKLHDNFWVEVRPKGGPANAFAPGANSNDKVFLESLRSLKPGDTAAITYTTDFERHRIQSLRINERAE